MIHALDGSVLNIVQTLLDDNDQPVIPDPGYPKVYLLDFDRQPIGSYAASPSANPGEWQASIPLPLFGIKRQDELKIKWVCRSGSEKYKEQDTVIIDPKHESRDTDIVLMSQEDTVDFVLPFRLGDQDIKTSYQYYSGNKKLFSASKLINDPNNEIDRGLDTTGVSLSFPAWDDGTPIDQSLAARMLVVKSNKTNYTYRLWAISPQVMLASQMIEAFVNKSRISNVIPELEYTTGDYLNALERGLYLFNMTGITTGFSGINMQGALLEAWVLCSSYWVLAAQLLAEGSLAFDFSGQGVTCNVDRTGQLESALGRIESRIQDTVVPLKKQLTTQGFVSGDGSIGATAMRDPRSAGRLTLGNAATTRINGGISMFIGRRF